VDPPRPGPKKPPIQAPSFTPPPVPSNGGDSAGDDADPLVGAVLLGRVRVVRRIAQGGMGRVYAGEQTRPSRPCAVKVLDPRLVAGEDAAEFTRRFLLEASVAASLTHPNSVTIFDYGQTPEGLCFIAMEYLEGRSLGDELRAAGRLSPERAIHVAQQVCRALREAHDIGCVHRDVKPGNVFLVTRDEDRDFVKVLDFGLVQDARGGGGGDAVRPAQIMGSPRYMAPEQVRGEAVDARADVYALGAMMYAMITGHPPFERASDLATMMAHVSDPPPPIALAAQDPVLPAGLEAVVMKCLSKSPDDRYGSMADLVRALNLGPDIDRGRVSTPRLVPPIVSVQTFAMPGDAATPPRRRGVPATAIAVVVLLGLAALGAGGLLARRLPTVGAASSPPLPPPRPVSSEAPVVRATVHVETVPDGAKVKEEGDLLCAATPCDVAYVGEAASPTAEHLLVFMKPDYKLERRVVRADGSPVRVSLTKARP
jgi:serine/threonine-protein kinase